MKLGIDTTAETRDVPDECMKTQRPRTATKARPRALAASGDCSHAPRTTALGERQPLPRAPRVSPRQRRRIEDTHAYLCARVDPIMGSLILDLMEGKPDNIRAAALDHLLSKKHGASGEAQMSTGGPGETKAGGAATKPADSQSEREFNSLNGQPRPAEKAGVTQQQQRLARRQDRLFMAREIGPLVTELIRRTLRCMPTDVEGFLIKQLQGCTLENALRHEWAGGIDRRQDPHPPSDVAGHEPPDSRRGSRSIHNGSISRHSHRPTRPSTARSRLQQAQNLDKHVQQTSPPVSGRTAEARRSPSPPRVQNKGGLPDEDDTASDGGDEENALPAVRAGGGSRVSGDGVKESQNKPWDIEVSSKLNAPSFEEQPLPPTKPKPQLAVILLLGLDGSGKTTLLGTLQGEQNPPVRPSVGFKPVTMMLSEELKVKFYDLGGGENIRSIWDKYYHDVHGLLYVVDGADGQRWGKSRELFLAATSHKYLREKPIAVILNKEDLGLQVGPEEAAGDLGLSGRRDAKVCCCSVNASKAKGGEADERLEGAVEWLLESVQGSFAALNERVQHDLQDMEREFQLEKEKKQLQVMRGLLRKAFPDVEGGERQDCFDESEGLEFLAGEVGLDPDKLDAEGAEVAALVGYQKLALQMVGNMKSPISRKNRARSWEEIRRLVVGLRREVGLDS
ncbi:unnamed protein product [Scytosiphon promiscuus]